MIKRKIRNEKAGIETDMDRLVSLFEGLVSTGSSGGGDVEVDVSPELTPTDIRIAPELCTPENASDIGVLVIAAYEKAVDKLDEVIDEKLAELVAGGDHPELAAIMDMFEQAQTAQLEQGDGKGTVKITVIPVGYASDDDESDDDNA